MVQVDDVMPIYPDAQENNPIKAFEEEEKFEPAPQPPVSGSAVLDLIPQPDLRKRSVEMQDVLPLSEVEDSFIESYTTATREHTKNSVPMQQLNSNKAVAEAELLSIDLEGNTPSISTTATQESVSATASIRRRPIRGRQTAANTRDSTTMESTAESGVSSVRRRRVQTVTTTQEDTQSNTATTATTQESVAKSNKPGAIVNLDKFLSEKAKNAGKAAAINTNDSTLEDENENLLQKRIFEEQKFIHEKNRISDEKKMEEEQKKLMNENNEEELRKKEERDRIKMKALEAERIRQQIELEQKIKPTQNGTQKAILQLPSTSVAPTTVSTTNDQTMESSQGLIGQIGGVIQTTTTGEYQETATIESTTSVRQRKPRTRIFTKESQDLPKANNKNQRNDVEFLDFEPTLPGTITTVAQTVQPDEKTNSFKYETYRDTIPSIPKNKLISTEEKLIPSIDDPLEPIKGFLKFQVDLIDAPSNELITQNASAKYDFVVLLEKIRAA